MWLLIKHFLLVVT